MRKAKEKQDLFVLHSSSTDTLINTYIKNTGKGLKDCKNWRRETKVKTVSVNKFLQHIRTCNISLLNDLIDTSERMVTEKYKQSVNGDKQIANRLGKNQIQMFKQQKVSILTKEWTTYQVIKIYTM